MANFNNPIDENIIADINVTPLVDISLVLVIIFMVVAPFLTHVLKPVELPSARRANLTEHNSLSVSIFPDGTLALGSSMIDAKYLGEGVKAEIAAGKAPWVLIRAGTKVPHGRVMEIVHNLKQFGIQRVAFATKKDMEEKRSISAPESKRETESGESQ